MFDNYEVEGDKRDVITCAESAEREALIDYVITTPPMEIARLFVQERTGKKLNAMCAHNIRLEERDSRCVTSFSRSFEARSGDATRSGFEHVLLGKWNTQTNIVGNKFGDQRENKTSTDGVL